MRTFIITLIVIAIVVGVGFALRKWGKHNSDTASKGGGSSSGSGSGSGGSPRDQRPT